MKNETSNLVLQYVPCIDSVSGGTKIGEKRIQVYTNINMLTVDGTIL